MIDHTRMHFINHKSEAVWWIKLINMQMIVPRHKVWHNLIGNSVMHFWSHDNKTNISGFAFKMRWSRRKFRCGITQFCVASWPLKDAEEQPTFTHSQPNKLTQQKSIHLKMPSLLAFFLLAGILAKEASAVFNGQYVQDMSQFPYLARINGANGAFRCTGSILSANYVLSAAHCVRSTQLYALAQNQTVNFI